MILCSATKKKYDLMIWIFKIIWSFVLDSKIRMIFLQKLMILWFWSQIFFDLLVLILKLFWSCFLGSNIFMIFWFWSQKNFDLLLLVLIHLVCKLWKFPLSKSFMKFHIKVAQDLMKLETSCELDCRFSNPEYSTF